MPADMTIHAPDDLALRAAVALRGVTKKYNDKAVLDAVDLTIPTKQTTVLLGPSGTGKSTLLKLALGLAKPDAGDVYALGKNVGKLRKDELLDLRQRFGMLFQDGALFGSLTVSQNIAFPLQHIKKMHGSELHKRIAELLEMVGLPHIVTRMPDQLSGGQRKRVALARAIALNPEVVLFDEPTSGLDPQTSAAIDNLVVDLQKQHQMTFIVITHDVESARAIAHHVGMLHSGKLRAFDAAPTFFASKDPIVRDFIERRIPSV